MERPITLTKEGSTRVQPVGFSFTTFFFNFFPALFRGDFVGALVLFGVGLLASYVPLAFIIFLFTPAMYNRNHFSRLLADGWTYSDDAAERVKRLGLDKKELYPLRGKEVNHVVYQIIGFILLVAVSACTVMATSMVAV